MIDGFYLPERLALCESILSPSLRVAKSVQAPRDALSPAKSANPTKTRNSVVLASFLRLDPFRMPLVMVLYCRTPQSNMALDSSRENGTTSQSWCLTRLRRVVGLSRFGSDFLANSKIPDNSDTIRFVVWLPYPLRLSSDLVISILAVVIPASSFPRSEVGDACLRDRHCADEIGNESHSNTDTLVQRFRNSS